MTLVFIFIFLIFCVPNELLVSCWGGEGPEPDYFSLNPSIDEGDRNLYFFSSCNGQPVVRKENIMSSPPTPAVPPEASFSVQQHTGSITGFRFKNPSGLYFDGICSYPELEKGVIVYPGPASADFTWFQGEKLYTYLLIIPCHQ